MSKQNNLERYTETIKNPSVHNGIMKTLFFNIIFPFKIIKYVITFIMGVKVVIFRPRKERTNTTIRFSLSLYQMDNLRMASKLMESQRRCQGCVFCGNSLSRVLPGI